MAEYEVPTSGSTSFFSDKRYWDGDTLNLTGTYTGDYTMNEGETINNGSISGTLTIANNCALNSVSFTTLNNVEEASDYKVTSCSISNVSLTNSMIGDFYSCTLYGGTIGKDCIGVNLDKCTIVGNLVFENANTCKVTNSRCRNSGSTALTMNNCTKCKAKDNIVYSAAIGLKMDSCTSCGADGNLFYNCTQYGVILTNNTGCSVGGGQMKNCGTAAYLSGNDSNTTLSANIIGNNSKAVIATGDDNSIISGNTIKNNSSHGVEIYETGASIVNMNTISNNSGNGVYSYNNDDATFITSNTIRYNSGNGIYCSNVSNGNISGNTIESNSKYGILLDGCTLMNTSQDDIKYHTEINEYVINCSSCSIGANSSYSKLGMKIYKCTDTNISLSGITKCNIGIFNYESDTTSFTQTEVHDINTISPTYSNSGEYKTAKVNSSWFIENQLTSTISIGIYDFNSSNSSYNDCVFYNDSVALFVKNTDGVNIKTNLFYDNTNSIVLNKSQSFQIVTNRIFQTENVGILIHSDLSQSNKICMNGIIDSNVISKCRLYYNSANFRIPEYLYPFDAFAIRFKNGIENDDTVIDGYDNITTVKALIDINDYVANNDVTHIYVDFMDDYSQVKVDYPRRFIKQYLEDLTTIDDFEEDDQYDIFVFSDVKQVAVIDNCIGSIYINNQLDALIKYIDSDKVAIYEYRKTMDTLIRDYAAELRTLSLQANTTDVESATSFLDENTLNDSYIKSHLTDQELQITTKGESSNTIQFNISSGLWDN